MANIAKQTSITDTAAVATEAVEQIGQRMGRKQFNGYLYDLYGCQGKNDVVADATVDMGDAGFVELFSSPDGLLMAIHHGFEGLNWQKVDVVPLYDMLRHCVGEQLFHRVNAFMDTPSIACEIAEVIDNAFTIERPQARSTCPSGAPEAEPASPEYRAVHGTCADLKEAIDGSLAAFGYMRDADGKTVKVS